jgi:protein phosphatase methylesterase 1
MSFFTDPLSALRIAKLPQAPQLPPDEDSEQGEGADSLGSLPTGMGHQPCKFTSRIKANPHLRNLASDGSKLHAETKTSGTLIQAISHLSCIRVFFAGLSSIRFRDKIGPSSVLHSTEIRGWILEWCSIWRGYSGLSFACISKEIGDMTKGECGILSNRCKEAW